MAATALAAASVATLFFSAETHIIYSVIILLVVMVSLLVGSLKAKFDSKFDGSDRQSVLHTFVWNDLLPNKKKSFLEFKTEIVIIEDGTVQSFYHSLAREVPPEDERGASVLKVTPFACDSSDVEKQKRKLKNLLRGVEAFIVVRTKELEGRAWVYDVLQEWAVRNSHAPCLVIDRLSVKEQEELQKQGALSPIPENYFFIDDDPKRVPWRLLKRADERAFAWRNQSSFNRLVGLIFIALFLVAFVVALSANSRRREEYEEMRAAERKHYLGVIRDERDRYETVVNGARDPKLLEARHALYEGLLKDRREAYEGQLGKLFYEYKGGADYDTLHQIFVAIASQTKKEYEFRVAQTVDANLHVSYWYFYDGVHYQLGTTEKVEREKKGWGLTSWSDDEPSIVGCAFANANSAVLWEREKNIRRPTIIPFNDRARVNFQDARCQYGPQGWRTLTSIVCVSHRDDGDDDRHTVGICAFTETPTNDLTESPAAFLVERAKEFQKFIWPYVNAGKLIPPHTLLNVEAHKRGALKVKVARPDP